jgi:hypothetical protein
MVRFANDILQTKKLELSETIGPALGTDSINLELSIGLNSEQSLPVFYAVIMHVSNFSAIP